MLLLLLFFGIVFGKQAARILFQLAGNPLFPEYRFL
jgi:hypothetical protein